MAYQGPNTQDPKLAGGVKPDGTLQGLNCDANGNLITASTGTTASTQSGVWTVQPGNTRNTTPWLVTQSPAASGGTTPAKVLSAASVNNTNVTATPGQLYSYNFFNAGAAARYVHFYNKATTPAAGTDVPVFTIGIPIGGSVTWSDHNGTPFTLGIGFAITTGAADTDAVAVGANDVTGFFTYK